MLDLLTAGYMQLHPESAAKALARLGEREVGQFLAESPPRLGADVLTYLPPAFAARCLQRMPADAAARIIARTPTEAAAEALRAVERERMREIFEELPRTTAARVRIRLRYPEGTVGSVVDADVLTLNVDMLVSEAVRLTRRATDRLYHTICVLDAQRRLRGSVDICDLLVEKDRVTVDRVMKRPEVVLHARTSLLSVENHPAWLTTDSIPVVTRAGIFQGVLPRDMVVREESQLATEVSQQQQVVATQSALSDVLWLALSALFSSQPSSKQK